MKAAAAGAEPFPWDDVIHVGLGLLRLSPRDFWAMTPTEFAAAAGLSRRSSALPPTRTDLSRLMCEFPDERRRNNARD
ncbi:MAG: phage tail assembly chaperone [Hyphomicrobiales bacterium]|nr:phage tail assembly chaperone [Hyphomicrobiales bacterium]